MNKHKNSIGLAMIVKNEADMITDCLASIKGLIDYWAIVDTGSTDNTSSIIESVLSGIPGQLISMPWVGFSENRNQALALVHNHCDYSLMLDADERLQNPDLINTNKLNKPAYLINCYVGSNRFARPFLFRNDINWQYQGVLHEWPVAIIDGKQKSPVDRIDSAKLLNVGDRSNEVKRRNVDNDITNLEKAIIAEPDNPNYRYHLGQNLQAKQRWQESISALQSCIDAGAHDYHRWHSLYYIGLALEKSAQPFEQVKEAYMTAFDADPSRIEPLYRLIRKHRIEKDFATGYELGLIAMTLETPDDIHPIDIATYEVFTPTEFGICCHHIGKKDEARSAYETALKSNYLTKQTNAQLEKNIRLLDPVKTTITKKF